MASPRLMRLLRYGLLGLVVVGILLQFVPVERTNPAVTSQVPASPEVLAVLRRACYDCHSNETRWPWYSRVAPISWRVAHHVEEARGDLNFSEWPLFDLEFQELAFHEIEEQIAEEKMPLWDYLLLHPRARLSEKDRQILLEWARGQF